jgi:hypothetical protein
MVLSVLVVVVVILVLGPLNPTGPGPAASPADGALPTGPAGATAQPGGGGGPGASVAASRVTWQPTAAGLIAIDERLIVARGDLADALASQVAAAELVRQLRAMNRTLVTADALIATLAETDAPASLVTDLQSRHKSVHDKVLETLRASVQNAAAYRQGAADIIAGLRPLEGLIARLASASGLAAPSSPAPGSSGSAPPG